MKKLLIVFLFLACVVQVRSQNPNTAKFPGAVATDQDLYVAKNVARPSVTLTSPVDNATLTLPVTDGTKFRQYQIIGVDLELMQVCSTAALSLTACGRGLGGTTAASHSSGAVIGFPFADIQVNQAAAEIKAIETALGINLGNVVQIAGSYTDPSWLTLTKAKVGLGNVENTALSTGNAGTATALAADPSNCTAGSAAGGITANGTAEACIVVNVRQIGFLIDDPNVALAARTYYTVWRNELSSNATIASVSCETDTDTTPAVIQFQKDDGSPVNMLSSNLTCSVAGASTTGFVAGENVVASGNRLDFVIVSNTSSKRVSLSIKCIY